MCVVELPYQLSPSLIFSWHPELHKAPWHDSICRNLASENISAAAGSLNYVTFEHLNAEQALIPLQMYV